MMIYNVIIIGGGASGLFASIFLPKEMKKLILEKNEKCGAKLLLSGGERCNVTNMDIDLERDYVGQNIKSLPSVFHAFNNQDMIEFLHQHDIETVVEDNGRAILKSGKAKQLLDLLMKLAAENDVEIKNNITVNGIRKTDDGRFEIETNMGNFACKKLIIATGGKSYPQVGATGFAYDIAKQFGIECIQPYQCLCGIETIQDMSGVTGNSALVQMQIQNDKKKCLYSQKGSVLFTHRGISGPVVFNSTLALGAVVQIPSNLPLSREETWPFKIKIIFDVKMLNKKLIDFFCLDIKNNFIELDMKGLRPREEAKVSGGGVVLSELKPNFESKKVSGLYFIGEACDVVGKTGGYNLQWAWSSGYVLAKKISF